MKQLYRNSWPAISLTRLSLSFDIFQGQMGLAYLKALKSIEVICHRGNFAAEYVCFSSIAVLSCWWLGWVFSVPYILQLL